jgi:hypothetical protein
VLHLNPKSGRWLPDDSLPPAARQRRHRLQRLAVLPGHRRREFLAYYGAEMLLEIARFWASIAPFDAARDRYEIHGVVGPDEFHTRYPDSDEPGLNNNAYTNVMAAWVLRCACARARPAGRRAPRSSGRAEDRDEELVRWDEVSRKLFVPFHDDGIISQFEGYERSRSSTGTATGEKYGDIQRLDRILEAEGDDVNRYKASKQADVLMLFYLFSAEELASSSSTWATRSTRRIPRNIDYYIARTSHGSTLSRVVHSWVLARATARRLEPLAGRRCTATSTTSRAARRRGHPPGRDGRHRRPHPARPHRPRDGEDDTLWFDPLPPELADVRMRGRPSCLSSFIPVRLT